MIGMIQVEHETTGDNHSYKMDGEGSLWEDEGSCRERTN